ncbi:MAG TPA: DJ-1/PfpI family protein [Mycobacteriales bacterium]|nr:DJ-1/PfpI family protein [Mycobacteriales bacterium]
MTQRIGIVLFDDVEELDAVGPWEVLAAWAHHFPDDGVDVSSLSPTGGVVRAAKGLRMVADHSFADAPAYDVLLHPGGQGTRPQLRDEQHLEWVRQQRAVVPLMTSVCTGSLVFAAAGLLRNRPATTHWRSLDLLAQTDRLPVVSPSNVTLPHRNGPNGPRFGGVMSHCLRELGAWWSAA